MHYRMLLNQFTSIILSHPFKTMAGLRKRNVEVEKPKVAEPKVANSVNIPRFVLAKLLLFSFLVISLPLLVFYQSLQYLGSTSSGILAALTANVVLIGYIIVAYAEGE